jgi:hypothetical protein
MIYAKELFSCILGMDDFGDEERKRTLEMREEDKEEDNGEEATLLVSFICWPTYYILPFQSGMGVECNFLIIKIILRNCV